MACETLSIPDNILNQGQTPAEVNVVCWNIPSIRHV
jgi:hypothetical protein